MSLPEEFTRPEAGDTRKVTPPSAATPFTRSDLDPAFEYGDYAIASNIEDPVRDVIHPILVGEDTLIVTGIEDMLSALAILMEVRPGLSYAGPGEVRLLLVPSPQTAGAPDPDAIAARHFGSRLPPLRDLREIGAVAAREAVRSGAVAIRLLTPDLLRQRHPGLDPSLAARFYVDEDFAAAGTAGFSFAALGERLELLDRVRNDTSAYAGRKAMAETLWGCGRSWGAEALEILERILPQAAPEAAVAALLDLLGNPIGARFSDGENGAFRDRVLARLYEYGRADMEVLPGLDRAALTAEIARDAARMQRCIGLADNGGTEEDAAPHWRTGWLEPGQKAAAPERLCSMLEGIGEDQEAISRPEIEIDLFEVTLSAAQEKALDDVTSALETLTAAARDGAAARDIARDLAQLMASSPDAALEAWRSGGMKARAEAAEAGRESADKSQSLLPMFAEMEPPAAPAGTPSADDLGRALASRSLRAIDKARAARIADSAVRHAITLAVGGNESIRRTLARRLAEDTDLDVVIVSRHRSSGNRRGAARAAREVLLAADAVGSADPARPRVVFLSFEDVATLSGPAVASMIFLGLTDSLSAQASALAAIDRPGTGVSRLHLGHVRVGTLGPDPVPILKAVKDSRPAMARPAGTSTRLAAGLADWDLKVAAPATALLRLAAERDFTLLAFAPARSAGGRFLAPPRLLLYLPGEDGGVLVRDQDACQRFLLDLFAEDARPERAQGDAAATRARVASLLFALGPEDLAPRRLRPGVSEIVEALAGAPATLEGLAPWDLEAVMEIWTTCRTRKSALTRIRDLLAATPRDRAAFMRRVALVIEGRVTPDPA